MKKILFYLIILLFLGCGESHKRQIALIKDYEQNFNGVKTDLKLKVLEIERIGTYPVDSLKIVSSSREERFKKYEDLMKIINDKKLEKELLPTYLVKYKIFNPFIQAEQELTKHYAFDPNFTIIVANW